MKFLGIFVIVLLVGLIFLGLGKQIATALQAGQRLDNAAAEVNQLQKTNQELKSKLEEVQKISYVEEIARDKLSMAKPGETLVVVPEKAVDQVLGAQKVVQEIKLPNWQGWLKLFTH